MLISLGISFCVFTLSIFAVCFVWFGTLPDEYKNTTTPTKKDTHIMPGTLPRPASDKTLDVPQIDNILTNLKNLQTWAMMDNSRYEYLGVRILKAVMQLPSYIFTNQGVSFLINGKISPSVVVVPEAFIIPLSRLVKPSLPDWVSERVFEGMRSPKVLNLNRVHTTSISHDQLLAGKDLPSTLIRGYISSKDTSTKVYQIKQGDPINYCFGTEVLMWMKSNLDFLPKMLLRSFSGKPVLAWQDSVRSKEDGLIHVPFSIFDSCDDNIPIRWLPLGKRPFHCKMIALTTTRRQMLEDEPPPPSLVETPVTQV